MAPTTTWKKFELWVARFFGSERNPLSGGNGKHSRSDSLHSDLFISCKYTKNPLTSLFKLVKEETEKAVVEDKIPVVVLGRHSQGRGKREDNTLVCIPISYLERFHSTPLQFRKSENER